MARAFRVAAEIVARDKATKTIRRIELGFKALSLAAGGLAKAGLVLVAGAVVVVTNALIKMGVAAGSLEIQLLQLQQNLRSLGDEAGPTARALDAQATALDEVSRASRAQILASQALLATFTQNEERLKALTALSLDASAALGTTLGEASRTLGEALEGNVTALERLGVVVADTATRTERYNAILTQSRARFGGEAASELNTFTGLLEEQGQAWGRVREEIGKFVSESDFIKGSIANATTAINGLVTVLNRVRTAGDRWGETLDQNRKQLQDQIEAATGLNVVELKLLDGKLKLVNVENELATARDRLGLSTKRLDEAVAADLELTERLRVEFASLGLTLTQDVNKEMERTTTVLGKLDEGLRRGVIDQQEYNRFTERAAQVTREQADAIGVEVTELEGYSGEIKRAIERTDSWTRTTTAATQAQGALTQEVIRTRQEFDRLAQSGSRAEAVQASLAGGGQLTQGGTRLRLPGGGSVLVAAPGFGGAARECQPSRFFEGQCTIV